MFSYTPTPNWQPTCAVFDCDGVLLDSETKWHEVQRTIFERHGVPMTQEIQELLHGCVPEAVARELLQRSAPQVVGTDEEEETYRELLQEIVSLEHEIVGAGVDLIPGALEVIEKLAQVMPVAVASNSSGSLLDSKMNRYGYAPYLKTWVGSDQVAHPKPAPDMYLRAVELIGGQPENALTFEDSATGVRAAQAAGTHTLVFVDGAESFEGAPSGNGYFSSFEDPAFLAQIDAWVQGAQAKN